jgi:hypothetical protein
MGVVIAERLLVTAYATVLETTSTTIQGSSQRALVRATRMNKTGDDGMAGSLPSIRPPH